MGLVLGLSLLAASGGLCAAYYLGREAYYLRTRFRRKYAAAFFAVLCAAAIVFACAALVLAVDVLNFGGIL